jgi:hypothetical protein
MQSNVLANKQVLKPGPYWKVKREVAVLRALHGGPHVVKLLGTVVCEGGTHKLTPPLEARETGDNGAIGGGGKGSRKKDEKGSSTGLVAPNSYALVFEHCGAVDKRATVGPSLASALRNLASMAGAAKNAAVGVLPTKSGSEKEDVARETCQRQEEHWRPFQLRRPTRGLSHRGVPRWRPLTDLEVCCLNQEIDLKG